MESKEILPENVKQLNGHVKKVEMEKKVDE